MGDRTWATLSFHVHYKDKVDSIKKDHYLDYDTPKDNETEIECWLDEVNYGIDDGLIAALIELKVEFNWRWGDGGEYTAGTRYYRKHPETQEIVYDEYYDSDDSYRELLKSLLEMSNEERDKHIKEAYEKVKQNGFSSDLEPQEVKNKKNFMDACDNES